MTEKVIINRFQVIKNDQVVFQMVGNPEVVFFFKEIYKSLNINYPKFFKMDRLSKLGFLAAELLLQGQKNEIKENMELFLSCSSSSLDSDIEFQKTIADPDNYFPSPSVFVYTLPNIVIGEIAIRHTIYGNHGMFIIDPNDKESFLDSGNIFFTQNNTTSKIIGYLDFFEDQFTAEFILKH